MTVYLDTSVVVSLFVRDVHSERARDFLATGQDMVVSRWTMTEYTSALSRECRAARISRLEQQAAELAFDIWIGLLGPPLSIEQDDFTQARRICREDGTVRAPDALHLCVADRLGLVIASFDKVQIETARRRGIQVVDL